MHTKTRRNLILSTGLSLIALLTTVAVAQTSRPSPTPASDEANGTYGNYNVIASAEFGARGLSVNGDQEKYKSDLNYRAGARLFNTSFFIQDHTTGMKLFDEALVQASGWGSDPTGSFRLNMSKAGIYKFDSSVRKVDYYNNLNNFALGYAFPTNFGSEHRFSDVARHFGDFDLTVFPESQTFRMRFGYSFNNQSGPGTWTMRYPGFEAHTYTPPPVTSGTPLPNTTGTRGDEFLVNSDFKNNSQDFRAGVEGKLLDFNLGLNYGHRNFNDDTRYYLNQFSLGNDTSQATTGTISATVNNFQRTYPTKGSTDFFNFYVQRTFARRFDFSGRFIYGNSTSDIGQIDTGSGTSSGNTTSSTARVIFDLDQIFVTGKVKRPQSRGDIGLTYRITDNFRISNTFNFDQFIIGGTSDFFENMQGRSQFTNANAPNGVPFNSNSHTLFTDGTHYRRFTNLIEADYQVNRRFAFNIGYRYTHRRVALSAFEKNLIGGATVEDEFEEDSNSTHSLILGTRFKPTNNWNVYVDFEKGQSDNVFTRLSNNDYTSFRVRSITNLKLWTINVSGLIRDNDNPGTSVPISFTNSSTTPPTTVTIPATEAVASTSTRFFSGSVDYSPVDRWSFSAGYTYNHQTSNTDVIVPVGTPVITTGTAFSFAKSLYYVRDNYFFFDVTVKPTKRLTAFVSYRIDNDSGQGDKVATNPFDIITSYPMKFQTPEVKVTYRINDHIDWNFGYQYYSYSERQIPNPYAWVVLAGSPNRLGTVANQNYSAHMPYTSVTIYFGRSDR